MPVPRRAVRLAPSLLSADFGALGEAVALADAGGADAFHLDVMDGHFVPNISFGPGLVRAVRQRTRKPLDVHLMISEPARYLKAFREAGGDTLVVHYEATTEPSALLAQIRSLGAEAGLALRPDTPVEESERHLGELDQLMVMGVHPGFSGQKFLPEAIPKLRWARQRLDEMGSEADLSVDGGVTLETGAQAAEAGATFFVCGSSIFDRGSVAQNLSELRDAVGRGWAGAVR